MTAVTPARRAALELLLEVERGRRLDVAFAARAPSLPERDRRFLQELTYGAVRLRGRLDHLLDLHLHEGTGHTPDPLMAVLRLGAYQILEMDGVPPYAAVSQAAEQAAERGGRRAAGLVNGVLRALQREGGGRQRFPDPEGDPAGHLATWHSHPRWLVERWLSRWPFADVEALVAANNRVPPLYLRPLAVPAAEESAAGPPDRLAAEASGRLADAAAVRLGEAGFEAEPSGWGAPCVELGPGSDPRSALRVLPAVVQDPGAALVPVFADPPPGRLAADLCSAPGGKTLALALRASYVFAADRSVRRLRLLMENVERLGDVVGPVGAVVAVAEKPPLRTAPFVLLDVPCTGTGTFRRHPDARWRLGEEDVDALAAVQERILGEAAPLVAPGGVLVYSTCTLEPEENEERVEAFLESRPGFRREPGPELPGELVDGAGDLRVLPQRTGFDGAYAARLRRVG